MVQLSHRVRLGEIRRRAELETSEIVHFTIEYVVEDADGNSAAATRDVVVASLSHAMRTQLLSGDVVITLSSRALVASFLGLGLLGLLLARSFRQQGRRLAHLRDSLDTARNQADANRNLALLAGSLAVMRQ